MVDVKGRKAQPPQQSGGPIARTDFDTANQKLKNQSSPKAVQRMEHSASCYGERTSETA